MSSSEDDRNLSEDDDVSEDDIPEEEDDVSEDEVEQAPVKKRKGASDTKPKPKKRRKPVNKFIEEEADVDEDEEEEEDDDDGDFYRSERALAEEVESAHQYRYEPQDRSQYDDTESAEEIVNQIKKRHHQSRKQYDEDDEGGDMMQSEVAQQSLLPSIQDPRMWVFKCKPGREQHLVIAMMNKFLEFARRGEPLNIKSVVASNSKGFIYVEAEREPHAKDALNGLRDVQQYTMKLVPIHEMTSVLHVQKMRKPLTVGAWTRMKRAGLYKGDLCKVLEILDNGARAVVKMIPRLDPIVLAGGEQPKYKKGQRPPQKLFSTNMSQGLDVVRRRHPSTGEMLDSFENDFYKDGFLIKEVNIATMLQMEDVNPTLDEINKFTSVGGGDGDGNDDLMTSVEADDWKNKVDLTKGDTVRVIEGDLINLMGVVLSTNTSNDTVRVMPLHEEIKDTILDFQLKQLMKYVKVGDHIKVVSGIYSGETGTVVAVDETDGSPVAIVLVDSMAKEIQVRVRDLQESAEVSHGLDSFKGKELYDLVALAHGDVGVVTHVGRDGFSVLCQNGQARDISDQEIQRKMVSSRATAALDKKHNHVSVGEMVNVVEGVHAGHAGTVKHIYRTYLFLHNNRMTTNAGIFVARARQVVLSGSKARSDMIQNSTVARMDGGMQPRGRPGAQRESEIIGKTVKIKKGMWKGYIGIVVDESDQKVKVEIHCKAKVVDVDRLHVTLAGTREGMIQDKPRYTGTPMNGMTPLPSQTPLHGSAMTPMATPLHRGLGTPQSSARTGDAWNVANDDALLETQLNQEKDITHATSFGTPLDPVAPSGDHMGGNRSFVNPATPMAPRSPTRDSMMPVTPAANPTTPGLNPTTPGLQPRTPAYMMSHNPTTPGLNPTTPGLNPTTPAHHLSAATPGLGGHDHHHHSGMEPMTPGFNPTTPGLSSMTPGLNPVTPGLNTPGYHHNPMTPGAFGLATPMTGMGRMNSAVTPAATPGMMGGSGVPMTPAYHHGADEYGGSYASGEVTWKMKGVEVEVVEGEYRGSVGVIVSVSGNSCSLDVDGRVLNVSLDDVQPVVPEKQDSVIILSGDEAGKTGSLIGTDGPDGIVKVDGGSEIKIYAIASLAKLAHSARSKTDQESTCEPMTDRKHQRHSSLENGGRLKKKAHGVALRSSSPATAVAKRGNNSYSDENEALERRLALQKASIALGARATSILNAQKDPETLDLRAYASELNDALLNELASQLRVSLTRIESAKHEDPQIRQCAYYATLILSGCEQFTPVGIRAFIHVVGSTIRRLNYSKSVMSIDILKVIATGIEQLDSLDFSWCLQFKSELIHEFISCCNAHLTTLNLSNCPALNDDALGWISGTLGPQGSLTQCRRLLSLDISYTKGISDRGLAALGVGCLALQFVNLEGLEKISNAGILKLVQGCKSLRVLSLRKCMQLTDGALIHIGEHCRQLRSLNLCGCFHLSSAGLIAMVEGTRVLQSLNLEGCLRMREDILAAVATSCLSLQVLNVNGCQEITDNGIATLAEHLPFVQKAQQYRGLEPKQDGLKLKFSIQQKTIYNSAALRIQAVFRGHVDRKIAASWRVTMIETPACKTIRKSYVRWRLNHELNQRVKRTKLVNTSVVKIQALARGVLCRAALERTSVEQQQIQYWSKFAVRVQAVYRSHWTRKHYHVVFKTIERYRKEQELLRKHDAVLRLQRAYRARFHRSRLDDLMAINQQRRLERKNAAIALQRLFRSRAARKAYQALRAALEQQHAKVRELVRHAMKIQSRWRGHSARRHLSRYQREMRERELHKFSAASRINAGVRGYFGRRVAQEARVQFHTRVCAARRIQRTWRRSQIPSAKRIDFERMLQQMQTHMLEEGDVATRKQEELLKKTRALIDRDSASEPESDDDWRDFQDDFGDQFWFSPSRKRRQYVRPSENAFEKAMLGMCCRVYWPLEQQWFRGVITRYNRVKNKHRVEYEDGDHEWICFHSEDSRIQLFNGYCWCMVSMFEPALRTLRATSFLMLRYERYDPRYLCWRSGVLKAYSEPSDQFLVSTDDNGADEWVDVFRSENHWQVQDGVTKDWYSLSGYVFGRVHGRPLNLMTVANAKSVEASFYAVEDYLSYVEVEEEPAVAVATNGEGAEAEETTSGELRFTEEVKDDIVEISQDESGGGEADEDRDGGDADDEEEEEEEDEEQSDEDEDSDDDDGEEGEEQEEEDGDDEED